MPLYLLESGKIISSFLSFLFTHRNDLLLYRSCFGHPGTYDNWMAVILCTAFAASGIGYISGAAVAKNSANVLAIIMCFIFCVFAGVEPTLKQVNQYPVVNWPWYLSFATWTAESTFYTWSYYLKDYGKVDISLQDAANHYDYNISHGLNRSIGGLLALGIAMRMIAIFFLWLKTK